MKSWRIEIITRTGKLVMGELERQQEERKERINSKRTTKEEKNMNK